MKIAIVGSRELRIDDLSEFIPDNVTEIISGGAVGIDTCAEEFARKKGIKMTVFLPDYKRYKRGAPFVRSRAMIEAADEVIAFWNGKSRGTKYSIDFCRRSGKKITVYILETQP